MGGHIGALSGGRHERLRAAVPPLSCLEPRDADALPRVRSGVVKPGTQAVLDLLRANPGGVTQLDALYDVGSFRLGARVYELREAGYDVETEWITTPAHKRVARYRLNEGPEQLTLGVA